MIALLDYVPNDAWLWSAGLALLAASGLLVLLGWPHRAATLALLRRVRPVAPSGMAAHRASPESEHRIVQIDDDPEWSWTAQTGPFEVMRPRRSTRGAHR